MTVNLAVDREALDRTVGFHEGLGRRTGWRVTGEDSHFAWKAIEAGIPIYYQPEAIVWHRIPANRMNRRFLLARCYEEGISPLDIEEKRGILSDERLRAHVRWHRRHVLKRVASLATLPSITPWNDPRVIEALSQISLSISIVRRGHHLVSRLALSRP